MEKCYDGKLVMPANYAAVSEEEMTYIDGGFSTETHVWGMTFYFSHSETEKIRNVQKFSSSELVKGLPGFAKLGIKAVRAYIGYKDKGKGVKMNILWNGVNIGIYSR
ncbi:MAG: hypothetical protein E7505_00080 [Ruminococcus sp.]|nr:hypothetical protein [Ruminococcus sp.]